MTQTARWIGVVGAFLALTVLAAFINPLSRAQAQQGQPAGQFRAVRVAAGTSATITNMGSTYHFLERRATRVTTTYDDGSAVAERRLDGTVRSSLRDRGGNEISQLAIDNDTGASTTVEFSAAGERVLTQPRPEVRPTLDWANLQAHALWKDKPRSVDDIEWQGPYVRGRGPLGPGGQAGANAGSLDDRPLETRTEFDNGLEVVTAKNSREIQVGPRVRRRPTLVSRVLLHGAEVGAIRWYAAEKVLAWDYPGLNRGFVNAERLKSNGGWTFTPTMAWANVQGLAFYEFHSRMKTRGSVAQAKPNLPQRLLNNVVPAVAADTPGCDGLHWLDSTVVRPCCDSHDRCYERNSGCSARSWYWVPWSGNSWTCSLCNTQATLCFLTGGSVNIDFQDFYFW